MDHIGPFMLTADAAIAWIAIGGIMGGWAVLGALHFWRSDDEVRARAKRRTDD